MIDRKYFERLIKANLFQTKLLRAQPEVNVRLVNDVLWNVLGLALQLDAYYEQELSELDKKEVTTIDEELEKRRKLVELAEERENTITNLFDRNDPDQNDLADLFADMRNQAYYKKIFYMSDVELVEKQLIEREEADKRVEELKVEKEAIEKEIKKTEELLMKDFEEINEEFDSKFEKIIAEYQIDSLDPVSLAKEKYSMLPAEMINDNSKEFAKTAKGINLDDFYNYLQEQETVKEEIERKIFLYEMGQLLREKDNSSEELLRKISKIRSYAASYEKGNPSLRSDLAKAFIFDAPVLEERINAPKRIKELEKRLNDIDVEIKNAYNNVKGKKEINDIIYGVTPEYPIKEEIDEINPTVIGATDENIIEPNDKVTDLVPLNEGEYAVVKVEKAKPSLLEKVKKVKDKIVKAVVAAALSVFILGSIAGIISTSVNMERLRQAAISINAEQSTKFEPNASNDLEAAEISQTVNEVVENIQKQYSITVGDRVLVSDGVKYYRNSQAAQLEQNSYETGRSGLKEGNYFVNRIALLAKDANGHPTGQIIKVNVTPGVSAEEVAKSLGLEEGSYDVIMHIGLGDSDGNFIEAIEGVRGSDDLCWIKTDGTYSNGLSLTAPNKNIERGMAR